ncbi:MAG: AMP-binding protein [Woeseia sp.]
MPGISQIRSELNRTQRRKLRRLLIDAWRNVPLYRTLYARLGLSERELADPQVLRSLPIISKADLLATPLDQRINRRFDLSNLTKETTTGSTGQAFSLYIDAHYRRHRNLRFLRGLLSAGYRPWHRLLLLTDRHAGSSRRQNWHYQSVEDSTEHILDTYIRVRPQVLYGFTTPLRLLAERLRQRPQTVPAPRLVVATAEMLDSATRRTLQAVFGCPVIDFYGMTEMGLVAWQRPGADGYITPRSAVLTELIPDDSCHGRYRMLMTNLDLRASPIIRFDSGDLAFARSAGGEPVITAFEGRRIDTLVCRDGTELSPYRITDALRDIPGVSRFKVTQRDLTSLDVDLEVDSASVDHSRDRTIARIREIFEKLLGRGLELKFAFTDKLIPDGTRKFRPVESRVLRP